MVRLGGLDRDNGRGSASLPTERCMTLADLPLGPLERAFVASLQRPEPQAPEAVLTAATLCCEALAAGDVCLPLERLAGRRPGPMSISACRRCPSGAHSSKLPRWSGHRTTMRR